MRRWVPAIAAAFLLGAASPPPTVAPGARTQPEPTKPAQELKGDHRQGLTSYERQSLALDATANGIAEETNRIAREQSRYGFWSLVMAAVAGVSAVAAAILAWRAVHWTRDAAKTAARAFSSSERPWLVLTEYALTAPVEVSPNGLKVRGRLVFENVGPALALNVSWGSPFVAQLPYDLEGARLQQMDEGRRCLEAGGGFVIAPGEEFRDAEFGANYRPQDMAPTTGPLSPVSACS